MINSDYSKAYSEVLEIISVLPRSEYNKIPVKYIEYLEENSMMKKVSKVAKGVIDVFT